MFFLIPIGSEEGVRRLPFITIGLIALNVVIWIITSIMQSGQEKTLIKLEEKMIDIEMRYVFNLGVDPMILYNRDPEAFHDRFLTDSLIPGDSSDFIEWYAYYREFKNKLGEQVFMQGGFIPRRMDILKMITYQFLHGGFFHLLFNMIFLWLVGCNIEDNWTWKIFLGLYLISGVVAALLHAAVFPKSGVPLIGASGSIAGIMGAFMIRHFKTKIRIAYFFWFFFRPIFGTFSIYAGIALPFWLIEQIFGASWSSQSGTAYYAHIGGFVFGAAVGMAMKFLGWEKKYVEPMVEESFEKYKTSGSMKTANQLLDAGDKTAAIPVLQQVVNDEPQNYDAPMILARLYHEQGKAKDAISMYDRAIETLIAAGDEQTLLSLYEELEKGEILPGLSEKNLFGFASTLEHLEKFQEALAVYGIYIRTYKTGRVRPKALYRTAMIFKEKLNNAALADKALAFLKKEYPDWNI